MDIPVFLVIIKLSCIAKKNFHKVQVSVSKEATPTFAVRKNIETVYSFTPK